MPEALFYHLTARPLEQAAPEILEKCRERAMRVTLRAGSPERVAALSSHLWTYRDESFLAHGGPEDGHAERQPIYLTAGDEVPNDPQVLFVVDSAAVSAAEFARFERTVIMFDSRDEAAVADARAKWREARAAGVRAVYWAQSPEGRWIKQTEAG